MKNVKKMTVEDYDFEDEVVQRCLSRDNRETHGGTTYICKTCDYNLRRNE